MSSVLGYVSWTCPYRRGPLGSIGYHLTPVGRVEELRCIDGNRSLWLYRIGYRDSFERRAILSRLRRFSKSEYLRIVPDAPVTPTRSVRSVTPAPVIPVDSILSLRGWY